MADLRAPCALAAGSDRSDCSAGEIKGEIVDITGHAPHEMAC